MTVKCKGCGTLYSITKSKNCPECGLTPSGHVPAAAGTAFSVAVAVSPAPPVVTADATQGFESAAPENTGESFG